MCTFHGDPLIIATWFSASRMYLVPLECTVPTGKVLSMSYQLPSQEGLYSVFHHFSTHVLIFPRENH